MTRTRDERILLAVAVLLAVLVVVALSCRFCTFQNPCQRECSGQGLDLPIYDARTGDCRCVGMDPT